MIKKNLLIRWASLWPPFLAAGIRIRRCSADFREIDVEMKLWPWNRNYVGVHYGGSLYSMTDPFYMLMLIENLGRQYIVWDKAASIRFRKPGKGRVHSEFRLSQQELDGIVEALISAEKMDKTFRVEVRDDTGVVIAEVEKIISIRRKDAKS